MGITLHRGFESRPLRPRRNRLNKRFLARAADGGQRARSPLLAPYGSVLEAIPTWTKLGGLAQAPGITVSPARARRRSVRRRVRPRLHEAGDVTPPSILRERGRSTGIESSVPFSSLWSLRFAPSWSSPTGTPAASVRTERFAPPWPGQWDSGRSWGLPAELWSSPRRLRGTTSRCPPPRRTPTGPDAISRGRPRPAPTPESAGAQKTRSTHRSRSARSIASRSEYQHDRVHRVTVGHPRRVTAQRVKRRRWKQRLDPLPQPVRHPPTIILADHVAHHRPPDRTARRPANQRFNADLHNPSEIGPKLASIVGSVGIRNSLAEGVALTSGPPTSTRRASRT